MIYADRIAGIARAVFLAALVALAPNPLSPRAFAQTAAATEASGELRGRALADALRHGGYVIYLRHTSTDFGQNDEGMTSFDDCAKQRNLTDQGRAEARAIGAAIGSLRIPIGDVLASPFCRTLETARLIFGRATPTPAVRGGPATTEDPDRYQGLRTLLSTPVSGGVNVAIVSHGNPFRAVAGTPYLAEGEAAVIEPLRAKGFRIVARVTKDGWALLDPR
jgi:phosphohistidine phosphatase SixA